MDSTSVLSITEHPPLFYLFRAFFFLIFPLHLWNFNLNEDTWINKVLFCWIAILDLWVNLKKILNEYRDFLRSPLSIYKNVLEVFFIEWVWQVQTISYMYFEGFLIFTVFTEIFYSFLSDLMIAIEEVKQVWCEQKVSAAMREFICFNWPLTERCFLLPAFRFWW